MPGTTERDLRLLKFGSLDSYLWVRHRSVPLVQSGTIFRILHGVSPRTTFPPRTTFSSYDLRMLRLQISHQTGEPSLVRLISLSLAERIWFFEDRQRRDRAVESRRQWRRTRQTIGPPRYTNALCDGRRGVDSAFPLPDFASPRGLLAAVDAPIATDCL